MRRTPPNLVLVPGTPAPPPRRTTEGDRATIVHVAGARRSLVKLAPVVAALEQRQIFRQVIVFTGQHSDMTGVDRWLGGVHLQVLGGDEIGISVTSRWWVRTLRRNDSVENHRWTRMDTD